MEMFHTTSSDGSERKGRRSFLPTPKSSASLKSSEVYGESSPTQLKCGDRVKIGGIKSGVIRYFGRVHMFDGIWCGIELDDPDGRHSGEVEGVRYFTCHHKHGIFAPASKVVADPLFFETRLPTFESYKARFHDEMNSRALAGDSVGNLTFDMDNSYKQGSSMFDIGGQNETFTFDPAPSAHRTQNTTFEIERENVTFDEKASECGKPLNLTYDAGTHDLMMDIDNDINIPVDFRELESVDRNAVSGSPELDAQRCEYDCQTFSPEIREYLTSDGKQYLNLTFGANGSPPSSKTKSPHGVKDSDQSPVKEEPIDFPKFDNFMPRLISTDIEDSIGIIPPDLLDHSIDNLNASSWGILNPNILDKTDLLSSINQGNVIDESPVFVGDAYLNPHIRDMRRFSNIRRSNMSSTGSSIHFDQDNIHASTPIKERSMNVPSTISEHDVPETTPNLSHVSYVMPDDVAAIEERDLDSEVQQLNTTFPVNQELPSVPSGKEKDKVTPKVTAQTPEIQPNASPPLDNVRRNLNSVYETNIATQNSRVEFDHTAALNETIVVKSSPNSLLNPVAVNDSQAKSSVPPGSEFSYAQQMAFSNDHVQFDKQAASSMCLSSVQLPLAYHDASHMSLGHDTMRMSQGRDDLTQLKVDLINGHHKKSTRPVSLVSSVSTDTGYIGSDHGMLLSGFTIDLVQGDVLMTASGTGVDSDLTAVVDTRDETVEGNAPTMLNEMRLLTDTLDITMAIAPEADTDMAELSETESCSDITDFQTFRPTSDLSDETNSLAPNIPLDDTLPSMATSESHDGSFADALSCNASDNGRKERRLSSKRGSVGMEKTHATLSKVKKNIDNMKRLEANAPPRTVVAPPPPEPKKPIQRTMPKSKWNNIMSQIESNKDTKFKPKKEVKSRLSEIFSQAPAPKVQPANVSSSSLKISSKPKAQAKSSDNSAKPQGSHETNNNSVTTPSHNSDTDVAAPTTTQNAIDANQNRKNNRRLSLSNIPNKKSLTVPAPPNKSISRIRQSSPNYRSPTASRASSRASSRESSPSSSKPSPKAIPTPNQNKKSGRTKQNGTAAKPDGTSSSKKLSDELNKLREARDGHEKEIEWLRGRLAAVTLGFDGMSVIVKYLNEQMDGFSCPALKAQLQDIQAEINEARLKIAELNEQKSRLEDEVIALNRQHEAHLEVVHADHESAARSTRKQLDEQHESEMASVRQRHSKEVMNLISDHKQQMSAVMEENEMKWKQSQSDHHNAILVLQEKHDSQMEELHQQHQNELTDMSQRFESIKVSLSEKMESMRSECEDLRIRTRLSEDALLRESDIKVQIAVAPYLNVAKEVESLKSVLEMRNEEIRQIQKTNNDLQSQLENLRITEEKVISLKQKNENLEAIVNLKTDNEKQLTDKYQHLLKKVTRETRTNKRLSMDYEELMWRMTRSEDPSLGESMTASMTSSMTSSHIRRSPPMSNNGDSPVVYRHRGPEHATTPPPASMSSSFCRLSASYEKPKSSRRRQSTPRRSLNAEMEQDSQEATDLASTHAEASRRSPNKTFCVSDVDNSNLCQDVSSIVELSSTTP